MYADLSMCAPFPTLRYLPPILSTKNVAKHLLQKMDAVTPQPRYTTSPPHLTPLTTWPSKSDCSYTFVLRDDVLSYVTNWKEYVLVLECILESVPLLFGVTQKSILDPLVFTQKSLLTFHAFIVMFSLFWIVRCLGSDWLIRFGSVLLLLLRLRNKM